MGRYTAEQRQGIQANRRARAAGLKYGYSYQDQGYTGAPESGKSAYALADYKSRYGAFASPTWDTKVENGVIMYRAKAQNPDRVAETGGGWFQAPDYVQRSYNNPNRQAYFANHATGAQGWQDFKMQQGLQEQIGREGLVQDAATGNWYHPQQGAFDPNGYYRTAGGQRSGTQGTTNGLRLDPMTGTYQPPPPPSEILGKIGYGSEGEGGIGGDNQNGGAQVIPGPPPPPPPDVTAYDNGQYDHRNRRRGMTLGTLSGLGA